MARKPRRDRRLERIQLLVLRGQWAVSSHVRDKIEDGEFELDDVEASLRSGRISESRKDERGVALDGRKYTIVGRARCGLPLQTVGKIIAGADGQEYFVITAYRWE